MPGLLDAERDGSLQAGRERHDLGGLPRPITRTVNMRLFLYDSQIGAT